jgi:hypothetical protein
LIPVLLVLAYPPGYPHASPGQAPRLRASDADRDIAVDILCAAVADGRLTLAELEERVGAALSARTRTELAALIADLRARPPRANGRAPVLGLRREGARDERLSDEGEGRGPEAARPAARPRRRWSLIQSLADTRSSPAPA